MISKLLLMPLLGLCWLTQPGGGSLLVFAGIMLGWLGDAGMLRPLKPGFFISGMLAFLLGHIFYLSYIFLSFSISVSLPLLILIPAVYLAASSFIYLKTRPGISPGLRPLCFLYMLALSGLSCISLLLLISLPCTGSAVAFAGASFFLISDAVLSQAIFIKKSEPPVMNFIIMLSYLLAQSLLAAGWALI